jgi:hypothetical protein
MGVTLFKTAFIVFCIVIFESLIAFFLSGFMNVSFIYPLIGFIGGFIPFIVCAILYTTNYRPFAKRKKHPTYIITACVLFVIAVILTSMIAVYFKANVALPPQLLSYIVLPVIYLCNILVFTGFYYLFSTRGYSNK